MREKMVYIVWDVVLDIGYEGKSIYAICANQKTALAHLKRLQQENPKYAADFCIDTYVLEED